MCIRDRNYKLRGLNDSKKILDPEKRDELALQIKQDAVCWSVGIAEVEEIDKINIYHAGLLAMQRAVQGLSLIHISEPTRLLSISYAVFCLKKKKKEVKN